MANKCMKKCSTTLAIQETQTNTSVRFHLLQSEWLSSVTQIRANADEDAGKRNPHTLLVGM
jgi:hypothetical protein